jgi:lysophospholipase L1-like esterase
MTDRTRARRVAIVLAVGFVGLVLAETAVRLRQWARIGRFGTVDDMLVLDPTTGLRVLAANRTQGGIRTNSLGFRGPEIAVPKPSGDVRLAFLGGSTTYCAEVSGNETTWPHLVWRSLQDAYPDAQIDYVNAGVPGYGLAAILDNFRARVQPLAPDVVVIYEATNDLAIESGQLAVTRGVAAPARADGSWLARHSLLWFLIEKNATIQQLQSSAADDTGKLRVDPRELSQGFERRLRDMVRAAQAVAPVVGVATFAPRIRRGQSDEEQRQSAVTALYYMPFLTLDGLIGGFEEYNRVIRTVAAETGALLIDGEDRIPADALHYNDSVHFRDAGSRAMAARVSQALLDSPAFRQLMH